jgi:hypothetical protein
MIIRSRLILSILVLLSIVVTSIQGQEATQEAHQNRVLPRPYTQEDLAVIVGNVQRPNGIVHLDGDLYIACNGDWTLYRVDAVSGSTITFVFGVQNAHTMVAEPTEAGFNLWIPDFDTNRLLLVDQRQTAPAEITTENLDGPWGIANAGDSGFLISNVRSNTIVHINPDSESRVLIEGLRSPAGLVVDGEYGYIVNNGSARRAIEWFEISDALFEETEPIESSDIMQPFATGLQNVSNLVLAEDGFLYFTYALGTRGVVGRLDPEVCRNGGCTNEEVEIVLFTELPAPLAGLTITPEFQLFVHTIYRPEIYTLNLYDPLAD